jgi:hypothetical protein
MSVTSTLIAFPSGDGRLSGRMHDQDVAWCIAQHLPELCETPRTTVPTTEHDQIGVGLSSGAQEAFIRRALGDMNIDQPRNGVAKGSMPPDVLGHPLQQTLPPLNRLG